MPEYQFNPNWMDSTLPEGVFDPNAAPTPVMEPPPMDQSGALVSDPSMAAPPVGPQMGDPGTMSTQFQGEDSPTTRYVPRGIDPQPLPSWMTNYDTERKAFLAQRKAENEAWSMAQQMSANKELEASYTKAMQLEGSLGFAAAVQAGVPVQQALAQYAPKMYWNNPAASSHALTGVMDNMARNRSFTPTSTTIDGQKMIQTSPNRYQFPPVDRAGSVGIPPIQEERTPGMSNEEKARIDLAELSAINNELSYKGLSKTRIAELEQEKKDIKARLSELRGMSSGSSVKRWRVGSDGKIMGQ